MAYCRPVAAFCLCSTFVAVPTLGLCQEIPGQTGLVPPPATSLRTESARPFGGHVEKPQDMPGWSQLVKPLGSDFRRLATRDNLGLIQIGAIGALTFSPFDRRVQDAAWGTGSMHSALKPGATVGGFVYQSSAALATYAVGRVTKQTRIAELGVDLVRAQVVSQTVTQAIKFSTQRTRPDGTSLSFPSGHTSSSFATASVVHAHFGLKAGIPAYAMAAWVAASRVQMKRHHVSDVIVGATVGLLAGRSVAFGRGSNRVEVSPMLVSGGAGVNLVRVGGRQ